jgi:hypothetical protein
MCGGALVHSGGGAVVHSGGGAVVQSGGGAVVQSGGGACRPDRRWGHQGIMQMVPLLAFHHTGHTGPGPGGVWPGWSMAMSGVFLWVESCHRWSLATCAVLPARQRPPAPAGNGTDTEKRPRDRKCTSAGAGAGVTATADTGAGASHGSILVPLLLLGSYKLTRGYVLRL